MGAVCIYSPSNGADLDNEKKSQDIDKKNKEEYKRKATESKLLLLGTGEAGKSTVMKQMQIYTTGFTVDERLVYKPFIYKQIMKNIKALIKESNNTEYTAAQTFDKERAIRVHQLSDKISDPGFLNQFTSQIWEDVKELWRDKSIQETFDFNHRYTLDDSTQYFLDKIDTLAAKDYQPTDQDILKSRVKTSAIIEKEMDFKGNCYRLVDVGGQRSERRKWAHCFVDITALVFFVAISEYDQTLRESNEIKRLDESFRVFKEIINNKYFSNKPVILIFNKMDIFKEKFKKRHLSKYFEDFQSDGTEKDAVEFLKKKFIALDLSKPAKRQIYFRDAVAIDSEVFRPVFEAMLEYVLHESLQSAGFIKFK